MVCWSAGFKVISVTLVNGFLRFFELKIQYEKLGTNIGLNVTTRIGKATS